MGTWLSSELGKVKAAKWEETGHHPGWTEFFDHLIEADFDLGSFRAVRELPTTRPQHPTTTLIKLNETRWNSQVSVTTQMY